MISKIDRYIQKSTYFISGHQYIFSQIVQGKQKSEKKENNNLHVKKKKKERKENETDAFGAV